MFVWVAKYAFDDYRGQKKGYFGYQNNQTRKSIEWSFTAKTNKFT